MSIFLIDTEDQIEDNADSDEDAEADLEIAHLFYFLIYPLPWTIHHDILARL